VKILTLTLVLLWTGTILAGEITGSIIFKGHAKKSEAVIYIDKQENIKFKMPAEQPVMDQKNLAFVPHVLPVTVGTTVRFKNDDKVAHNIFTPSPAGDMFNLGTWKGTQVKTHTFNKTGEVVLLCNLHPEMEGYIYVTPNPYFAKTDKNGEFVIKDVPAGKYKLKVWAEQGNARPQTIKVPQTGSVNVNFTVR
jgi:plastocyanin